MSEADEAIAIGPAASRESYLKVEVGDCLSTVRRRRDSPRLWFFK